MAAKRNAENSDIQLLFGVAGGGSISGASGKKISKEISDIVNHLNNGNPYEIKFKADPSSLEAIKTQVDGLLKDVGGVQAIKIETSDMAVFSQSVKNISDSISNGLKPNLERIKNILEEIAAVLPKSDSALAKMGQSGSVGLIETINRLDEVRSIIDEINRKNFSVKNVFQYKDSGGNNVHVLELYRSKAEETLKYFNALRDEIDRLEQSDAKGVSKAVMRSGEFNNLWALSEKFGKQNHAKDIADAKTINSLSTIITELNEYAQTYTKVLNVINSTGSLEVKMPSTENIDSIDDDIRKFESDAKEARDSFLEATKAAKTMYESQSTPDIDVEGATLIQRESVRKMCSDIGDMYDVLRAKLEHAFDFSSIPFDLTGIKSIIEQIQSEFDNLDLTVNVKPGKAEKAQSRNEQSETEGKVSAKRVNIDAPKAESHSAAETVQMPEPEINPEYADELGEATSKAELLRDAVTDLVNISNSVNKGLIDELTGDLTKRGLESEDVDTIAQSFSDLPGKIDRAKAKWLEFEEEGKEAVSATVRTVGEAGEIYSKTIGFIRDDEGSLMLSKSGAVEIDYSAIEKRIKAEEKAAWEAYRKEQEQAESIAYDIARGYAEAEAAQKKVLEEEIASYNKSADAAEDAALKKAVAAKKILEAERESLGKDFDNVRKEITEYSDLHNNDDSFDSDRVDTYLKSLDELDDNFKKHKISAADFRERLSDLNKEFENLKHSEKNTLQAKTLLGKINAGLEGTGIEGLDSDSVKELNKIRVETERLVASIEEATLSNEDFSRTYDKLRNKAGLYLPEVRKDVEKERLDKLYSGIKNKINDFKGSEFFDNEIDGAKIQQYESSLSELKAQYDSNAISANEYRQALSRLHTEFKHYETPKTSIISKDTSEYGSALQRIERLLQTAKNVETKYTSAKSGVSSQSYQNIVNYVRSLEDLKNKLQSGRLTVDEYNRSIAVLRAGVTSASNAIRNAGENTQTLTQRLMKAMGKFGEWFGIARMFSVLEQALHRTVTSVIELDTSMTELKKVTDEADSTYENFLVNATVRARKLGAALTDTVTASADFARLGYNLHDAERLADAAIVYKNVGDGITDISTASESIIATMQAFGVTASDVMLIVDKFNEVGNNFAISSKGIGDALLRSAAAMKSANNTLDETIALITAANTIVQNPETVGTTLKTVSMYLRAAKTEAEEAGETTDGMASSISELRSEILALTGNKVDIQTGDSFKSTYQILKELAAVWNSLNDISKANILEMVGGKRNANVVAALLENFSVAERAAKSSAGAAGSALAENEKQLESINGKLAQLSASFETLSMNVLDSDIVKLLVDTGTAITDILNGLAEINLLLPMIAAGTAVAFGVKNVALMANAVDPIIDSYRKEKLSVAELITKLNELNTTEQQLAITRLNSIAISEKATEQEKARARAAIGQINASNMGTGKSAGIIGVLGAAIPKIGIVISVLTTLITVISVVLDLTEDLRKSSSEKLKELEDEWEGISSTLKQTADDFSNLKRSADEVIPRFAELAKGVNEFGEQTTLTDEEYAEFLELNNKVAELFPELNLGMDTSGNAMLALSYSADTLTDSLYALVEAQRAAANQKLAEQMPDVIDNIRKQEDIYDSEKEKNQKTRSYSEKFYHQLLNRSLPTTADSYGSLFTEDIDDLIEEAEKYGITVAKTWKNVTASGNEVFDLKWNYDDLDLSKIEESYERIQSGYDKIEKNYDNLISSNWKKLNHTANYWIQTTDEFANLNSRLQSIAQFMVSGIDFGKLGIKTEEQVQDYIQKNIVDPLYFSAPEVKTAFAEITDWQEMLKSENMTADEFSDKVKNLFEELISAMDPTYVGTFKTVFVDGMNAMGISCSDFDSAVAGLISNWDVMSDKLNSELRITDEIFKFRDTISVLKSALNEYRNAGSVTANTYKKVTSLGEDYGDLFDFTNGKIELQTEDLIKLVEELQNETGARIASSGATASQIAMLSAYTAAIKKVESSNDDVLSSIEDLYDIVTDMNEGTELSTFQILDLIKNYPELITSITKTTTGYKLETNAVKDLIKEKAKLLSLEETEASQAAKARLDANNGDIAVNVQSIFKEFEENNGRAISSFAEYESAWKKHYGKPEDYVPNWVSGVQDYVNALIDNNEYAKIQSDILNDLLNGDIKAGISGDSDEESEFEKLYKEHQHKLAMEQETFAEYLAWLESNIDNALKTKQIELDEYRQYKEEIYEGSKTLFSDSINDTQHQIELLKRSIESGTSDSSGYISDLRRQLKEAGDEYNSLINGNVDYNKRPVVSAEDMKAVYPEFDGDAATTYSQYHTIGDENYLYTIDITPILEDGTVLTQDELDKYISNLVTTDGISGLLNSDVNDLIINVAPGDYDEAYWNDYQSKLQDVKDRHLDLWNQLQQAERDGSNPTDQVVSLYKGMMGSIADEIEHYKSLGLDNNSDFIQELENQWWSARDGMMDAIRGGLDTKLGDYEHDILMLENADASADEIIEIHRKMQDELHATAEEYRALGLSENDDLIQELQKQWLEHEEEVKEIRKNEFNTELSNKKFGIEMLVQSNADKNKVVESWRDVLRSINDEISYYLSLGYEKTDEFVQELVNEAWSAKESIISSIQEMVTDANEMVDGLQSVYTTVTTAAKEYASTGYLSVDSLQSILELGPKYLQFLMDEHGQLTLNEVALQEVIAARTEEMAAENALAYAKQILLAVEEGNIENLKSLTQVTLTNSGATWDMAYATIGLAKAMGVAKGYEEQYFDDAVSHISKLQAITETVVDTIPAFYDTMKDGYVSQSDALNEVLNLTQDLIKWENDKQIEALEKEKELYSDIVKRKKEMLQLSKEERDHEKSVAEKLEEIARLQSRIDQLSLDDSREAQAQKRQLEEELNELQKELADEQADYSYDAQIDALDKEAEEFEKNKDNEIDILENNLNSAEKLYQAAINRINNGWDALYTDLINWNYQYGSTLQSDLVDIWDAATAAVQRYGTYANAVIETKDYTQLGKSPYVNDSAVSNSDIQIGGSSISQNAQHVVSEASDIVNSMKQNSRSWLIADSRKQADLEKENEALADQWKLVTGERLSMENGTWYRPNGETLYNLSDDEIASIIVPEMKRNSAAWSATNSTAEQDRLAKRNLELGTLLEYYLGKRIERDDAGVWRLDGRPLYDIYHSGGVVGNTPTLRQNEVMAVLEDGEIVLDNNREESLFEIIDFVEELSERLGRAIDISKLDALTGYKANILPSASKFMPASNVTNNNMQFSPTVHVTIAHNGQLTDSDARRIGSIAADSTLKKLDEAFAMRGIGNIGNSILK